MTTSATLEGVTRTKHPLPTPPPGEEPFLTVDQVAAWLQVAPQSITRWARSGELRGMRLSPRLGYRFTRADVQAFIDKRWLSSQPKGDSA